MTLVCCAGCERPILDKFIFNVIDRSWHQTCIICNECKCGLNGKCFSRDGKLYCKNDFYKLFGPKCGGCNKFLNPSDLVRRARDRIFHLKCFTCNMCNKELSTGDQLFMVDENKFICKHDFMNNNNNNNNNKDFLDDENSIKATKLKKLSQTSDIIKLDSNNVLIKQEQNFNENKYNIITDLSTDDYFKNTSNNNNSLYHNTITQINQNSMDSAAEKENLLINSSADSTDLYDMSNKDGNSTDNILDDNDFIDSDKDVDDDEDDDEDEDSDDLDDNNGLHVKSSSSLSSKDDNNNSNGKKRGPRTTIKAKQLEMLKSAFSATPKPTRHIREQLAQETGLNMRVIQVWFQNRRSKERRMKQLSAMGNRRHYYRNASRLGIDAQNSNLNIQQQQQQNAQNRQMTEIMNNGMNTNLGMNQRQNRFEPLNDNNDLIGQNFLHNGEFYGGQNGFTEFMIQSENPLQRLNYHMEPNLLNTSEVPYGLNTDLMKCSSSPDEVDHFGASITSTQNQILSASTNELEW